MIEIHRNNPFLLSLYELHRDHDHTVYFVMEYMPDGTLCDFIRSKFEKDETISVATIQSILFQVATGISTLHSKGFLHRDLKPENLLLNGSTVKVADFSLSRQGPKSQEEMTAYVSTRWYRAPEIVLASPQYSFPVDIFALGCIVAELFNFYPLFPSESDPHQLKLILELLGPLHLWAQGVALAQKNSENHQVWNIQSTTPNEKEASQSSVQERLKNQIPGAPVQAIALLESMLKVDPEARCTCDDILRHPFVLKKENSSETTTPITSKDDQENVVRNGPAHSADYSPNDPPPKRMRVQALTHQSDTTRLPQFSPTPMSCDFDFGAGNAFEINNFSSSLSPTMQEYQSSMDFVSPKSVAEYGRPNPTFNPPPASQQHKASTDREPRDHSNSGKSAMTEHKHSHCYSNSPAALFNIY